MEPHRRLLRCSIAIANIRNWVERSESSNSDCVVADDVGSLLRRWGVCDLRYLG
jgi:hypothetical protein